MTTANVLSSFDSSEVGGDGQFGHSERGPRGRGDEQPLQLARQVPAAVIALQRDDSRPRLTQFQQDGAGFVVAGQRLDRAAAVQLAERPANARQTSFVVGQDEMAEVADGTDVRQPAVVLVFTFHRQRLDSDLQQHDS